MLTTLKVTTVILHVVSIRRTEHVLVNDVGVHKGKKGNDFKTAQIDLITVPSVQS